MPGVHEQILQLQLGRRARRDRRRPRSRPGQPSPRAGRDGPRGWAGEEEYAPTAPAEGSRAPTTTAAARAPLGPIAALPVAGRGPTSRQASQASIPALRRRPTLVHLERLNSRRRLLREEGEGPPIARRGATRSLRMQPSTTQLFPAVLEAVVRPPALPQPPDGRADGTLGLHPPQEPMAELVHPEVSRPPLAGPQPSLANLPPRAQQQQQQSQLPSAYPASEPLPSPMQRVTPWVLFSWLATCCLLAPCLVLLGKRERHEQQAYREKVALCIVVALFMAVIGFISFGLRPLLCPDASALRTLSAPELGKDASLVYMYGYTYDLQGLSTALTAKGFPPLAPAWAGRDVSPLFPRTSDQCNALAIPSAAALATALRAGCVDKGGCVDFDRVMGDLRPRHSILYRWEDVGSTQLVFNSRVVDVARFQAQGSGGFGLPSLPAPSPLLDLLAGTDGTYALSRSGELSSAATCLSDLYTVGFVDRQSWGCTCYSVIMAVLLAIVIGVTLVKFLMALTFHWVLSYRLTQRKLRSSGAAATGVPSSGVGAAMGPGSVAPPKTGRASASGPMKFASLARQRQGQGRSPERVPPDSSTLGAPNLSLHRDERDDDFHTIMFITCYSEGVDSIESTLSALARTEYPDSHKLLFVVADGLITGSGNGEPTFRYVLRLMEQALPCYRGASYIAVANGPRQANRASVYTGYYRVGYHHISMLCVVKEGCAWEQSGPKPGNRGKRDSQVILMNFLSRLLCGDSMTELDYALGRAITQLTGLAPDVYAMCLMVDADTIVRPDSVRHMVQAMKNDPKIMGLCGETRISNKLASFWTMIQVFEYFISHHFGKSFESVFGGVTCLPGCFSMYRIKVVRPTDGMVIPLLVCPEVVEEYAENIVETLHKKNLLLLGEDRFLTTLLLRCFPKRRMVFIPQSIAHTQVPDTFKVLLSQRRRWINSTIHNLLELVLLRELCGIFCFSMQFVIALELIGTVVLPAALAFTYFLVVKLAVAPDPTADLIPLLFLLASIGLPGVLILVSSRKLSNLLWMLLYLLALPVWSFALPLYSFWNMDDFSWGETRVVEERRPSEQKGGPSGDDHVHNRDDRGGGAMELPAPVLLQSWAAWEAARVRSASATTLNEEEAEAMVIEVPPPSPPRAAPRPVELPPRPPFRGLSPVAPHLELSHLGRAPASPYTPGHGFSVHPVHPTPGPGPSCIRQAGETPSRRSSPGALSEGRACNAKIERYMEALIPGGWRFWDEVGEGCSEAGSMAAQPSASPQHLAPHTAGPPRGIPGATARAPDARRPVAAAAPADPVPATPRYPPRPLRLRLPTPSMFSLVQRASGSPASSVRRASPPSSIASRSATRTPTSMLHAALWRIRHPLAPTGQASRLSQAASASSAAELVQGRASTAVRTARPHARSQPPPGPGAPAPSSSSSIASSSFPSASLPAGVRSSLPPAGPRRMPF